jgi:hypothetical protein
LINGAEGNVAQDWRKFAQDWKKVNVDGHNEAVIEAVKKLG